MDGASLINAILEKSPEADLVFPAGSHKAEEKIGRSRPRRTPMTVADFALDHFFANVQLAGIVMEGNLRKRQHRQQFGFLSPDFLDASVQGIIPRLGFEDEIELPPEAGLVLASGRPLILEEPVIIRPQGV